MSKQKQSRIDVLEKKQSATTRVLQELINEFNNIRTMSVGVYTLVKDMPGYEEAVNKLKEKTKKDVE
jgi:hypothetical protein